MKLLVHQPRLSYFIGGGETVPLQQAETLSQLGNKVEILTSKPPKYSEIYSECKSKNPQIIFHELELQGDQKKIYEEVPGKDWSRWDKEALFFGQAAFDFYSQKNNYDLVITHLLSDSLFVPLRYDNVLHLHGVPSERRAFDEIFLTRPNHFVSVSKYVGKGWKNLYPELENTAIETCYNGIDTDKFVNKSVSRDIDLLFVGRLIHTKGIFYIIDAIKLLQRKGIVPNKLVIIGLGPELENLKAKCHEAGIADMVEFLSNVSPDELNSYYNRSKVFLCPSYEKEGVLTTMMEAASCGCAIITADCCGMIEFAKNNVNSMIVQPKDSESLTKVIEQLLRDEKLREKLTKQATEELQQNWDTKHTVRKLAAAYQSYAK